MFTCYMRNLDIDLRDILVYVLQQNTRVIQMQINGVALYYLL